MLWFVFALLGAFFDATYYLLIKRYLRETDRYLLAAGVFLSSFLFLFIFSLIHGLPPLGPRFLPALLTTSTLNTAATFLYFLSLRTTDLSLSIPMISFTPLFLLLTSWVILHEAPSLLGGLGALLIVSGSYLLNTTASGRGLAAPLKTMLTNRGVLYMLAVAMLYSITSNYDKLVVVNSDPFFGSSLISLIVGSVFASALLLKKRSPLKTGIFLVRLPAAGLVFALSAVTINLALLRQIVPYVISIKRMSILLTVVYGGVILGEKGAGTRALAAVLMAAGAALIVIFH